MMNYKKAYLQKKKLFNNLKGGAATTDEIRQYKSDLKRRFDAIYHGSNAYIDYFSTILFELNVSYAEFMHRVERAFPEFLVDAANHDIIHNIFRLLDGERPMEVEPEGMIIDDDPEGIDVSPAGLRILEDDEQFRILLRNAAVVWHRDFAENDQEFLISSTSQYEWNFILFITYYCNVAASKFNYRRNIVSDLDACVEIQTLKQYLLEQFNTQKFINKIKRYNLLSLL